MRNSNGFVIGCIATLFAQGCSLQKVDPVNWSNAGASGESGGNGGDEATGGKTGKVTTTAKGGSTAKGGNNATGGAHENGGTKSLNSAASSAGDTSQGASTATGGTSSNSTNSSTSSGAATATGGATGVSTNAGGTTANGGVSATGGTKLTGGTTSAGGTKPTGGTTATGGTTVSTGGTTATGGTTGSGRRCDLSKPFDSPVMIVNNLSVSQGEHSMSVSENGLSAIVAVSEAGSNYRLKYYERSSITEPFMIQQSISGESNINTDEFIEMDPRLSRDGLYLFYTASCSSYSALAYSSRKSTSAAFGPRSSLDVGVQWKTAPWVDKQYSVLYWVDSAYRIWQASASFTGSTPQFSDEGFTTGIVDPGMHDNAVVLTDDQLTMYFSSDRVIPFGNASLYGHSRIWRATRNSTSAGWGNLAPLDELDQFATSYYPTDVSSDGCIIYYRAKNTNERDYHLYQAIKPK
jgi:hypothetical protein